MSEKARDELGRFLRAKLGRDIVVPDPPQSPFSQMIRDGFRRADGRETEADAQKRELQEEIAETRRQIDDAKREAD
jgi:hypothetical protein